MNTIFELELAKQTSSILELTLNEEISETFNLTVVCYFKEQTDFLWQEAKLSITKENKLLKTLTGIVLQSYFLQTNSDGTFAYKLLIQGKLSLLNFIDLSKIYYKQNLSQIISNLSKDVALNIKSKLQNQQNFTYQIQYQQTHFDFLKQLASDNQFFFYEVKDEIIVSDFLDNNQLVDIFIKEPQEQQTAVLEKTQNIIYNLQNSQQNIVDNSLNRNSFHNLQRLHLEHKTQNLQKQDFLIVASEDFVYLNQIVNVNNQKYQIVKIDLTATMPKNIYQGSNNGSTYNQIITLKPINDGFYWKKFEKPLQNTLQIAKVQQVNEKFQQAQINFIWEQEPQGTIAAQVLSPFASQNQSLYFMPKVDDEVIVNFLNQDLTKPVIIGSVFNNQNQELTKANENISYIQTTDKDNKIINLTFDNVENKFNIHSDNEINITAAQTINLKENSLNIENQENIKITSRDINIENQKFNHKLNEFLMKNDNAFIKMTENELTLNFKGSQIRIDSTGIILEGVVQQKG